MGEDELREDGEKEIEEDKGGAEVKVDVKKEEMDGASLTKTPGAWDMVSIWCRYLLLLQLLKNIQLYFA